MDNFTLKMEEIFLPVAHKIGNQRHLAAIKDGFIATMPISLAGAIAAMMTNVFLTSGSLIGELLNRMAWYADTVQPFLDITLIPVFDQIWWGTIAVSVLFSTFTISANLAKNLGEDDGLIPGIIAVASYLVLTPSGTIVGEDWVWGIISWNSFNSQAIFAGLITALVATELYCWVKKKGWVIKMPDSVPPSVSKAFSAVIPAGLTLLVIATISTFFLEVIGDSFQVWANDLLQAPLVGLGQSPISLVFLVVLSQLLWFFGLHGMLIVEPALTLMYGPAGAANQELVMQGLEPVYAITRNFIDVYAMHGGSGSTLGLIIAIFIFSKKPHHRTLAKMSLAPGIFQINEPMTFGLPLVLNPIMAIPFIFVPAVTLSVAWFFTAVVPFAGYLWASPPWTTPTIINAFLGTGGDIGATILSVVTLLLSILLYIPFVLVANRDKSDEKIS